MLFIFLNTFLLLYGFVIAKVLEINNKGGGGGLR